MRRRRLIASLLPGALALGPPRPAAAAMAAGMDTPADLGVSRRALRFPADHGAHPDTHLEWWYVTGWLRAPRAGEADGGLPDGTAAPEFGFQLTFFRVGTGFGKDSASRFAARQLVLAHLALTDLAAGHRHAPQAYLFDQRAAREGFGLARAPEAAGAQIASLGDWSLAREAVAPGSNSRLTIEAGGRGFGLRLALAGTQAPLAQGEDGWSQKSPNADDASHYYSEPQLAVRGRLERAGRDARDVVGRAWLDHEWSQHYLAAGAMGWDWIGINLHDGSALMAFRQRRPDGGTLWAGGTLRDAAGRRRTFGPAELAFEPVRTWTSPRTRVTYPVELALVTPAGRLVVRALQDDQELDGRSSTGSLYWEGLVALLREDGREMGRGYLELTGYGDRLKL